MNTEKFNTNYYYIKQITTQKIPKTNTLWRGGILIARKDNQFVSWFNTSTSNSIEDVERKLLFGLEKKETLIREKPNDWKINDIYQIIAEYFHLYNGSVRLDITNYNFHDDVKIIKQKIQNLSDYQKYLMIYPSNEFCHNVPESEFLFRVKFRLYYLIEKIETPSDQVKLAYSKLDEVFVL